jgi:hypothetical protein
MTESEIAHEIGVDQSTISRDVKTLKELSRQFVYDLAKSDLAYGYKQCIDGVERLSIVPIRNVDDVFAALKDGDTLTKVLEQGLEEQYLSRKEPIVKNFMSIKDKIKKEDLRIVSSFTSNMKTTCMTCQGFANIHCINCSNVWLCSSHWKQHQVEKHTPRY